MFCVILDKNSKPNSSASETNYRAMIAEAILDIRENGGTLSRQAILEYIKKRFNVGQDNEVLNRNLELALRTGVTKKALKQNKNKGASARCYLCCLVHMIDQKSFEHVNNFEHH